MPAEPSSRIHLQYPAPAVDGGRYPAKRCVGDAVEVSVDAFRDGHDLLRVVVQWRGPGDGSWQEKDLRALDREHAGVRWGGGFPVDRMGRWEFRFRAWTDVFATWTDELTRKIEAGQHHLDSELGEGAVLLADAAARSPAGPDRRLIEHALATIRDPAAPEAARYAAALGPELGAAVERHVERHGEVTLEPPLPLEVDRVRARFGSWYELFPRSWGGLKGVESVVGDLAGLGFDVLYMPPIHPIGVRNRKGRDNALVAGPRDPGSPYAIGSPDGGHDAVHPDLGTLDDVRRLCATARSHGMDVCLDFAIQCSADHPWLTEHPEWFQHRPDGTLKYAENPPKRYQDIYNVDWECEDWEGLWREWRRVVLHWVDCGVRIFRVDNPHTKPFAFWEWLIDEVHAVDREVVFLAEAFTRRAVMRHLGKLGFEQSYTYFTWKNSRWELQEYVGELAASGEQEYFRPNFFANTPDILSEYLQDGGPPAFTTRLVLAATLSPSYGIYSGFEHFENVPVRPGSEEYAGSEKYELRVRALDGPLLALIKAVNLARRENPALQHLSNVTFLETENDAIIAYAKRHGDNVVICAVNLDPHGAQSGVAVIPAHLGLPPAFRVRDLLLREVHDWRIGHNYVRLEPPLRQAHLLVVEPS